MPKVLVKAHVRDPETGQTYLRNEEAYDVDAPTAYRLASEYPERVEEVEEPQTPQDAPQDAPQAASPPEGRSPEEPTPVTTKRGRPNR